MAKHIFVKGVAQGVGFRSFVYGLATQLDLHGWVCTMPGGMEILVEGQNCSLEKFMQAMTVARLPLARIDSIQVDETPDECSLHFEIRETHGANTAYEPIFGDAGICPDCERELFNPKDPRYLYPFISCAYCGPRFTIIKAVPYDRPNTTMADFPMCEHCRAEYTDPFSRRFQVQSISCPECGPFVELRETHSQFPTDDPRISSIEIRTSAILKARRLLREGYIVAIKGPGGFHLACDASNPYTVAELRDRKNRIDKPFAIMAANLSVAVSVCEMQRDEHILLSGHEKPIIILNRKKGTELQSYQVSELVAPNLDTLGVMLPYTPLHHLLLNQTDPVLAREPAPPILVMTSGNFGEEPIAADNKEALERLSPLADAFLLHNLDIHIRSDDSVVRVDKGNPVYLRRSRGYAPFRVELPFEVKPVLAVGGERKNTFCLARGHEALLSPHIGDMQDAETRETFEESIQHLSHTFHVEPEIFAHDLHPNYFTTRFARHTALDLPHIGIQHHHAHIAACMADNGLSERKLIGVCFDESGYGLDGTIWGGELLLASYEDFERFAHLEYLPLPGEDAAIRFPWRGAVAYTHALDIDIHGLPFLQNLDKQALRIIRQQVDKRLNVCFTSSVGHLFNVVTSLTGIRNEITYEEQALMEMAVLSKPYIATATPYPYFIEETESRAIIRLRELLSALVQDVRAKVPVGRIGARFQRTVAEMVVEVCQRARSRIMLNEVALSGGVWQNQSLLDLVREGLRQREFTVYFPKQVPANDGGLALGQAVIANHIHSLEIHREFTGKFPE